MVVIIIKAMYTLRILIIIVILSVQDQAAAGSTPHKDKTITTAKRDNYVLVDNR